jgi:hypothetical protein
MTMMRMWMMTRMTSERRHCCPLGFMVDLSATASKQQHTADRCMVLTKRCLQAELDCCVRDCCGFGFELNDGPLTPL